MRYSNKPNWVRYLYRTLAFSDKCSITNLCLMLNSQYLFREQHACTHEHKNGIKNLTQWSIFSLIKKKRKSSACSNFSRTNHTLFATYLWNPQMARIFSFFVTIRVMLNTSSSRYGCRVYTILEMDIPYFRHKEISSLTDSVNPCSLSIGN